MFQPLIYYVEHYSMAVKDKDIQLINVNHFLCIYQNTGRFKLIQEAICLAAPGNAYFPAIKVEILYAIE